MSLVMLIHCPHGHCLWFSPSKQLLVLVILLAVLSNVNAVQGLILGRNMGLYTSGYVEYSQMAWNACVLHRTLGPGASHDPNFKLDCTMCPWWVNPEGMSWTMVRWYVKFADGFITWLDPVIMASDLCFNSVGGQRERSACVSTRWRCTPCKLHCCWVWIHS
jgi:hypothetical protein